jgi:hypothetical protein
MGFGEQVPLTPAPPVQINAVLSVPAKSRSDVHPCVTGVMIPVKSPLTAGWIVPTSRPLTWPPVVWLALPGAVV